MDKSIWEKIGKMLIGPIVSKAEGTPELQVSIPLPMEVPSSTSQDNQIDWTKATCQITPHFTVAEAITLHAWNRLANETDSLTDEIKANIVKTCQMMEQIRTLLGCSINIHCIFRSQKYNQEVVKAIPNDVHAQGLAADYDVNDHYTIEQAKEKLRPKLEELNIRMEGGTTTWIHNDWHAVGPSGREFKA